MNKIKRFFIKKKKEKEYRQYIQEHKNNVLRAYYEMVNCKDLQWVIYGKEILEPLFLRALEHDDSKLDKEEFSAYRAHYFPINEQEKMENEDAYIAAWEHHKANNDHHWQARVDWADEDFDTETELACLENLMDWLAVGYKFNNRPYEYYESHKEEIKLPPKQTEFMEKLIYDGIDKKITGNSPKYAYRMDIEDYSIIIPIDEDDIL